MRLELEEEYEADAGLVEAKELSTFGSSCWRVKGLTWAGHEFLDAARNDTVWNKTKEIVKDKGGSVPFEVVKDIVIEIAKKMVGL